jgi:hypothetical protein
MAENVNITIKAFDKTKKGFGSVASGLKKVTGAVFSMRSALAVTAGAAGFGLLVKKNLEAIDSLSKTAQKIGTTTEALSALRYAAEISGVQTSTLDMAMQRFTRRLAEAAKGTGEAKGALKELNINASSLMKLPLDEQMLILSDRFSKVTNSADKVRLAMKLFDSEGVALVNTLGLGAEEMKALMQEAETLGLVMSSDAAKGVEDANDALTNLKSLFIGLARQMTAGLAPAIHAISEMLKKDMLEQIELAGGSIEDFGRQIAVDFIEGAKKAVRAGAAIGNAVIGTYNAMISAKAEYDIKRDIDIINDLLGTSGLNPERIRFFGDDGIVEYYSDSELKQKKNNLLSLLKDLQNKGQGTSLIDPIDIKDVLSGLNEAQEKTENYKKATDTVVNANANATESVSTFRQAFDDFSNQLPTYEEGITSLTNNAMDGFTKGFTDAITGAAKFSDAMKAMAKSVVDSLIKMLVQYYITQSIFGAITGMFGGGGNANAAGNAAGTNLGGSMSMDGGGFTGYGSRSGGVDGKGGFPAILHPNETVIDHTKGQSSGVVVQQTINVTTGVQQTVRAEIVQLMPQIALAAKGAVADARLRGGNFSKAMAGA